MDSNMANKIIELNQKEINAVSGGVLIEVAIIPTLFLINVLRNRPGRDNPMIRYTAMALASIADGVALAPKVYDKAIQIEEWWCSSKKSENSKDSEGGEDSKP